MSYIYNKYVINLYGDLKPRTQPRRDAPEINAPLQYLGRYFYVYSQGSQSNLISDQGSAREVWYLLVSLEDETGNSAEVHVKDYLGWIPGQYVPLQREALRDPATGVHLKAFAHVPLAELQEAQSEILLRMAVPARIRPFDRNAPQTQELRVFNFYFVMAQTGDNLERDWVFLATQYEIGQGEFGAEAVAVGWVELKYFQLWTTREAIQWSTAPNRPFRPGKIWPTPEEAMAAGPADDKHSDAYLFREPVDQRASPVPQLPEWPRFPILHWAQAEKYRTEIRNQYPGWKLLKVCVPGGLVNKDGIPIASAQEINPLKSRLSIVQQPLQTLELMFVIDDTESMEDLFPTQLAQSVRLWPRFNGSPRDRNCWSASHFTTTLPTPDETPSR